MLRCGMYYITEIRQTVPIRARGEIYSHECGKETKISRTQNRLAERNEPRTPNVVTAGLSTRELMELVPNFKGFNEIRANFITLLYDDSQSYYDFYLHRLSNLIICILFSLLLQYYFIIALDILYIVKKNVYHRMVLKILAYLKVAWNTLLQTINSSIVLLPVKM